MASTTWTRPRSAGRRLGAVVVAALWVVAMPGRARADDGVPARTAVFIDSDEHGLSLLERTPQGDYLKLCEAPCSTELAPGRFQGAVSRRGGERMDIDDVLIPKKPARLKLRLDRARGTRVGGWIFFGLGLAGGLGSSMLFMVSRLNEDPSKNPGYGWLAAGLVSLGVSAFGLGVALTSRDSASVDVGSSAGSSSPERVALPAGPALRWSF